MEGVKQVLTPLMSISNHNTLTEPRFYIISQLISWSTIFGSKLKVFITKISIFGSFSFLRSNIRIIPKNA